MQILVSLPFPANRLSNLTIGVGNKLPFNTLNFDPRTFIPCSHVTNNFGAGETRTIHCDSPVTGRYVSVYLNKTAILTLCEVQVHGLLMSGKTYRF